jgi:hypothetical protein
MQLMETFGQTPCAVWRPARTQRFAKNAKNATFFDGAEARFDCNLSKTGRFAAIMHFVNVPDSK